MSEKFRLRDFDKNFHRFKHSFSLVVDRNIYQKNEEQDSTLQKFARRDSR